jgi:hypothetical protein
MEDDGNLDFLDEGRAPADNGGARWQVRRKSGKVFGPVDGPAIVALLRQGQLIGNEEISADGQSWNPIASEATFAKEIRGAAPLAGEASASIAGAGRIVPPVMPAPTSRRNHPGPGDRRSGAACSSLQGAWVHSSSSERSSSSAGPGSLHTRARERCTPPLRRRI